MVIERSENKNKRINYMLLQRIMKYLKMVLVHVLVLIAVGGILYGYTQKWVADKEAEIREQKIQQLEQEIIELKK